MFISAGVKAAALLAQQPGSTTPWLVIVLFVIGLAVVVFILRWVSKRDEQINEAERAVADDLLKIKGVDSKNRSILMDVGITTFSQLAEADEDEIQGYLEVAHVEGTDPRSWIDQAKLAAKGEWDGLAKLQEKL
jgi:hypothetical protein